MLSLAAHSKATEPWSSLKPRVLRSTGFEAQTLMAELRTLTTSFPGMKHELSRELGFRAGIEPTTGRLQVFCSTIEHPVHISKLASYVSSSLNVWLV